MPRSTHPRQWRAASLAAVVAAIAATSSLAAEPPEPSAVEFDIGSVPQALTEQPGDVDQGKIIMSTNALGNCVACHQISAMPDVDFQGNVGPSLDGVAERYDEAHLRGLVIDAKRTFDGTIMPAFYKNEGYVRAGDGYTGKAPEGTIPPILDAQQVEDVVAYLLTLKW